MVADSGHAADASDGVRHAKALGKSDEAQRYIEIGKVFADHQTVGHTLGEYVRGEVQTNTIEGYFSILKRGITGV